MKRPNIQLILFYLAALFFAVTMLTSCASSTEVELIYFDGSRITETVDSRSLNSHTLPRRYYNDVRRIQTTFGSRIIYDVLVDEDGRRYVPRRISQPTD